MKDHMRKFALSSVLALALVSPTSAAFAQQAQQPFAAFGLVLWEVGGADAVEQRGK